MIEKNGCELNRLTFNNSEGVYRDGIAPDGHVLSDHMLLGAVVATILILDNTAQVRNFK